MPTVPQLPEAAATSPTDKIAIDQSGLTRSVTINTLTSNLQPKLTLAKGALLGRVSTQPGGPEPIAVGAGLSMTSGTLTADLLTIARLDSPTLTGSPTAPTPPLTDSSNRIATTAFVEQKAFSPVTLTGDVQGTGLSSIAVSLPSITTAGSFTKVSVNAKGQVTAGGQIATGDLAGLDFSQGSVKSTGASTAASQAARAALQLDAVLDFGADPTGAADSTTAIQNGLNALASAGGGRLRVAGTFKITTTLTIRTSHVSLIGNGMGQLHGDLSWPAPSKLVWAGSTGGTILDVAPNASSTTGRALIGCEVLDLLLDCASLAAIGIRIASVRHGRFRVGYLNPLAGTANQAAVVLDTVDLAEYNDTQHNHLHITGAELGPGGRGVLMQGKSRGSRIAGQPYYGNVSVNIFDVLQLHYWRGVPLTLRETDNNIFKVWGLNGPPAIPPSYATPAYATCNSIEIEGSSDSTWAFPALNNVFEHGGCAGPIMCRGSASFTQASGQSAGSVAPNLFLRLDKGNGVPDPTIETGAYAYFGDINFIENGRGLTQATLSDTRAHVLSLRSAVPAGSTVLHSGSGPAARVVSPSMSRSWNLATQDDGSLALTPNSTNERWLVLGSNTANAVQGPGGFWAGDSTQSQISVNGSANGQVPTLRAISSTATNVSLALGGQGNATTYLVNGNGIQFQVSDSGGPSANFLYVRGATTGNGPALIAVGSDTNVDLNLAPQGTGLVRLGTVPTADNSTAAASTAWVRNQSFLTTVPIATAAVLGGIKRGANLAIDAQGVLSVPSLDAAPIGATTPSTGAFTTLSATGSTTLAGTVFNSGGAISVFNSTWTEGNPGNGAFQWNITGSVPNGGVLGTLTNIFNNGPNCAQAQKMNYWSYAGNAGSVDNAQTLIGIYNPTNPPGADMGAELVRWTVGVTPNDSTHNWTHVVEEYNVVNRGRDMGWKAYRNDTANGATGAQQITGIVNYSPEATNLGTAGEGKNLLFAELFGQSAANTASTGIPARFYNASLYEPNCVVGGSGRAIYINGDLTGITAQIPYAPLEVSLSWLHGFRTTTATFQDGAAFTMAQGQMLAWSTGSSIASIKSNGSGLNQDLVLSPAGSGAVRLTTATGIDSTGINLGTTNGTVLQVKDIGTTAATKLVVTPGNGAGPAVISLSGETNQGLVIRSSGTGQINFQSGAGGSTNSLTIAPNATAVNALSITGGSTGQNVVLGVNGSDPNVTIQLVPQGTGTVYTNKAQLAGGTIDGTTVGTNVAAAGRFTTLNATGAASFSGGIADGSTVVQTPTTGFSITVAAGVSTLQLTPAATLASGTITMPSSPVNGQWLFISSTQNITTCSFAPGSGQTMLGAPATLPAYVEVVFQYQASATRWICQAGNDSRLATMLSSTSLSPYAAAPLFGTGADGAVTISSGTTTLTRDMHYANLTLSGSGTLNANGHRIFVSGTLDLSSAGANAIFVSGGTVSAASGTAAGNGNGAVFPAREVPAGAAAVNGVAGGSGGGTAGTNNATTNFAANGGQGGAGGTGGTGVSAGGSGGTIASAPGYQPQWTTPTTHFALYYAGWNSTYAGFGGSAGGAGGGDGTNAGGGSGAGAPGGGWLSIYARTIQRGSNAATGIVVAKGGIGGSGGTPPAGNTGGGAGGGGGGGGVIYIVTEALMGSAIINAMDASGGAGGAGGAGLGTGKGGNGGAGGNGGNIQLLVLGTPSFTVSTFNAAGAAGGTTATTAGASGGAGALVRAVL